MPSKIEWKVPQNVLKVRPRIQTVDFMTKHQAVRATVGKPKEYVKVAAVRIPVAGKPVINGDTPVRENLVPKSSKKPHKKKK